MAKRKSVTAQKAFETLNANPEWVAKRDTEKQDRDKLKKLLEADELELVRSIRRVGYVVDSVWDLVNNTPHPVIERNFVGPYELAYPILIAHLQKPHLSRTREGLIRALTVKDGGDLLEQALLLELSREDDPELRWVLGNALRAAMPYHRRRKYPEIKEALAWDGHR